MVPVTLFDRNFREIGPAVVAADIECGDSASDNDIEIKTSIGDAYGLCILGTDAGGFVEYLDAVTGDTPEKKAFSWRGLLKMWVLEPPRGNDYLIIQNMDLNKALETVLSGVLGGFFSVPDYDSGITVSRYQFNLYTDALTGLSAMCESVGARLYIHAEKSNDLKKIIVYAEAKRIKVFEEEFSEASSLKLEFIRDDMKYNHMICMGKGELQNRLRVDLYLQADGTFGTSKHFTGLQERQYYYDDNNAETVEKLTEDGLKKFPEICPIKKMKVKKAPEGIEIGDIVKGTYAAEGVTVVAPLSKKIYRVMGDRVTVEYAVKENNNG